MLDEFRWILDLQFPRLRFVLIVLFPLTSRFGADWTWSTTCVAFGKICWMLTCSHVVQVEIGHKLCIPNPTNPSCWMRNTFVRHAPGFPNNHPWSGRSPLFQVTTLDANPPRNTEQQNTFKSWLDPNEVFQHPWVQTLHPKPYKHLQTPTCFLRSTFICFCELFRVQHRFDVHQFSTFSHIWGVVSPLVLIWVELIAFAVCSILSQEDAVFLNPPWKKGLDNMHHALELHDFAIPNFQLVTVDHFLGNLRKLWMQALSLGS